MSLINLQDGVSINKDVSDGQSPKIKIFISCHKEFHIPENSLLCPVQVGCALSPNRINGYLYDDVGDNISAKNKSYCELTAQYWAWKNVDADYYGFFHYRCYLSFAPEKFKTTPFGEILVDNNSDDELKKFNIDSSYMEKLIPQYDLIVPSPGGFAYKKLTMYTQYKIAKVHRISDLDFVLDIIKRDYPDMYPYAKKYLNLTKGYFCNMFIMKKELFQKYCEWLFPILKEHEEKVDISDYTAQEYRVHGYLAERLCGIYIYWLEHTANLKILKLQRTLFDNVEVEKDILPAFNENNVPVVFSANNFYVPFLSTVLQSLKENSTAGNNYDILILHTDISAKNQTIIKRQLSANNFCVRFINVARHMKSYNKLYVRGHFRVETYFRLLLPEMLPHYKKTLYLDSDMIVCADVAELYNTDITGYLLAACKDPDTAGLYNGYEPNKKNYMDNILKLSSPYTYFQAGTILFNLDEFRRTYSTKDMMQYAMSYKWELLDQDVLNHLAENKTKFVDMSWNVMVDWKDIRIKEIISLAPHYLYNEYMASRTAPKIIHYAGPDKPWGIPSSDFAEFFWQYAKNTPYYEIILSQMISLEKVYKKINKKSKSRTRLLKIAAKLFPPGTKRRQLIKKILGRNR